MSSRPLLTTARISSQLLSECVTISEILPESEGQRHLAKAKYKLSILYDVSCKRTESIESRQHAFDLKANLQSPGTAITEEMSEQESFERLTPWMLW